MSKGHDLLAGNDDPASMALAALPAPRRDTTPSQYVRRLASIQALCLTTPGGASAHVIAAAMGLRMPYVTALLHRYTTKGYIWRSGRTHHYCYHASQDAARSADAAADAMRVDLATRAPVNRTLRKSALALIVASGGAGCNVADLSAHFQGVDPRQISQALYRLRTAGEIVSIGQGFGVRYFGDQAAAQVCLDAIHAHQADEAARREQAMRLADMVSANRDAQRDARRAQQAALREERIKARNAREVEESRPAKRANLKRRLHAQTDARSGRAMLDEAKPSGTTTIQPSASMPASNGEVTYAPGFRHVVVPAPKGRFEGTGEIPLYSTLGLGNYLREQGFSAYLNHRS